jgi:sporulation protein YlmC with PRC-barrel domain
MADTDDTEIAIEETTELIASDKVEGTAVYDQAGEKLGAIHNFMVDKHSGQVEYAVLSFGGLFGLGTDHYPLPWDMLDYDTEKGGYVVDIDKETLEEAPRYAAGQEPEYDRDYGERIYDYYGFAYPYA